MGQAKKYNNNNEGILVYSVSFQVVGESSVSADFII